MKLNGGLFYCVMNCGKRPIVAKGGNSSKHLQSWEGKGGTKNPFHCGCKGTRSMEAEASTRKTCFSSTFLFFDYYITI